MVRTTIVALSALLFGHSAVGEETGRSDHHAVAHHDQSVGVFVGVTGEDRRERAGTLGVEYERRFGDHWGAGGAVEYAFGSLDFAVAVASLAYHYKRLGVFAGPGIEWSQESDAEGLFRAGIFYEFEYGDIIVSPKFAIDFIDGETVLVGGIAVGMGF